MFYSNKFENKLAHAAYVLGIIAVFSPFFVWSGLSFPFITFKNIIFRLLVLISLLIWTILVINDPDKYFPNKRKKIFWFLVCGYLLVVLLSALLNNNPYGSILGGNERMGGFINLFYVGLFIFTLSTIIRKDQALKLLKVSTHVGLLVSLSAILFYFGIITPSFKGLRFTGIIGNAGYLSLYLIFTSFLSLLLFFRTREEHKAGSLYWLIIFFIQFCCIVGSGTRGSLLGCFLGLLILFLACIQNKTDKQLKNISKIVLVIFLCVPVCLLLLKHTDLVKNGTILQRFTTASLATDTAQARLISSKIAIKSWLQKPFLGWGIDNYQTVYIRNFDKTILKAVPGDYLFDRVHNMPLEVLSTTGIFGFLFYYSLFIYGIYWLVKRYHKDHTLSSIVVVSMIIGYLTATLFLFDIYESYLCIAFIAIYFLAEDYSQQETREYTNLVANRLFKICLSISILLCVSFLMYFTVIKPFKSSRYLGLSRYYLVQNELPKAQYYLDLSNKNLSCNTRDSLLEMVSLLVDSKSKMSAADFNTVADNILVGLNKIEVAYPNDYLIKYNKAKLLFEESATADDPRLIDAEKITKDSIKSAPLFVNSQELLCLIYGQENKNDLALKQADYIIKNITTDDPNVYWVMGVVLNNQGKPGEGFDNFLLALKHQYSIDEENLTNLIQLGINLKRFKDIIPLYQMQIQNHHEDLQNYASLAAAYQKIGDYTNARITAQRMLELNPSLKPQIDAFLKTLPTVQ